MEAENCLTSVGKNLHAHVLNTSILQKHVIFALLSMAFEGISHFI